MHKLPSNPLAAHTPKVWRITGSIHSAIVCLVAIGVTILTIRFELSGVIAGIAITLAVLYSLFFIVIYPKLYYRRWRYEIYDDEIELMRGVLFVSRTIIPMVRIQHVDTMQGPVLRIYGLAAITFSTAAGHHKIPALTLETADHARERIAWLARVSREDV